MMRCDATFFLKTVEKQLEEEHLSSSLKESMKAKMPKTKSYHIFKRMWSGRSLNRERKPGGCLPTSSPQTSIVLKRRNSSIAESGFSSCISCCISASKLFITSLLVLSELSAIVSDISIFLVSEESKNI